MVQSPSNSPSSTPTPHRLKQKRRENTAFELSPSARFGRSWGRLSIKGRRGCQRTRRQPHPGDERPPVQPLAACHPAERRGRGLRVDMLNGLGSGYKGNCFNRLKWYPYRIGWGRRSADCPVIAFGYADKRPPARLQRLSPQPSAGFLIGSGRRRLWLSPPMGCCRRRQQLVQ